jgi:hypothetical protein
VRKTISIATRRGVMTLALLTAVACACDASAVELVGRAVLPARTFAPGPTSGQFIKGTNGVAAPFVDAQPVQGFSGILPGPVAGTYNVITDNGFGQQGNSADALLRIYSLRPDFATGQVTPVDAVTGKPSSFDATNWYVTLRDPDQRAGFATVSGKSTYPNRGNDIPVAPAIASGKLLTGADFDVESIARGRDGVHYLGDEFGPFVLKTDATGRLLRPPIPVPNTLGAGDEPLLQSPQYPTPSAGSPLPARGAANIKGSGGLEAIAITPDKSRVYTVIERDITGDRDPRRRVINMLDTATDTFLPDLRSLRAGDPKGFDNGADPAGNSISDMTMINRHQALILERDERQGRDARFKRVYLIDLDVVDADGYVSKTLLVDLLRIPDPDNRGGKDTVNGVFSMPFLTIESVAVIDAFTILVVNDNNFPFTTARAPGVPDDSEFVLIRLDRALALDPALMPRVATSADWTLTDALQVAAMAALILLVALGAWRSLGR